MIQSTIDDHIDHPAVTRMEVQFPGSSMRSSKQKDDDCVSENSFGSDFDDATDEENLKARLDGNTKLESPPPVYSDVERPQSMLLSANMPLQYTPIKSTELEPAFNVNPNLSGLSMCVVRGLNFN